MKNTILHCDLHDYLEIACLYKIEVTITLLNNSCYSGKLLTTGVNKATGEFITISLGENNDIMNIAMMSLKSMQPHSKNIHFDHVVFNTQQ